MGAHDPQPSAESVPLNVLGSARGSSVAVKARSPHSAPDRCEPERSVPENCALRILPSRVPVLLFVPPFRVTTRVLPDCEIEIGACETEERKSPQAEVDGTPDSIFQTPSTKKGAVKPRPLFRTPTSPRTGSPTKKTYAITKLRLECEIAFLPLKSSGAVSALQPSKLGAEGVRGQVAEQFVPGMLFVLLYFRDHGLHLGENLRRVLIVDVSLK